MRYINVQLLLLLHFGASGTIYLRLQMTLPMGFKAKGASSSSALLSLARYDPTTKVESCNEHWDQNVFISHLLFRSHFGAFTFTIHFLKREWTRLFLTKVTKSFISFVEVQIILKEAKIQCSIWTQ